MKFAFTLATLFASALSVYGAPQGLPGDPAAAQQVVGAGAAAQPTAVAGAAAAAQPTAVAGAAAAGQQAGAGAQAAGQADGQAQGAGNGGGNANNDVTILNFALTLEHLEAEFYKQGLEKFGEPDFRRANVPDPTQAVLNFHHILAHESKHVTTLQTVIQSLGGQPVPPCEYNFPMDTVEDFMKLASVLEKVGVSAYNGAVALLENPDLQTAAATIDTIEARHASFLNTVNGLDPFPAAFDPGLDGRQVVTLASPVIKQCPFELPFAPFGALKVATTDPIKPGDSVKLEFQRAGNQQHFCNFLFADKSEVSELSDSDECEVPQDVRGDIFMMVTSSRDGVTLKDTNAIIAGPVVVNIDTAHDDSCEKFIGKDGENNVDFGFDNDRQGGNDNGRRGDDNGRRGDDNGRRGDDNGRRGDDNGRRGDGDNNGRRGGNDYNGRQGGDDYNGRQGGDDYNGGHGGNDGRKEYDENQCDGQRGGNGCGEQRMPEQEENQCDGQQGGNGCGEQRMPEQEEQRMPEQEENQCDGQRDGNGCGEQRMPEQEENQCGGNGCMVDDDRMRKEQDDRMRREQEDRMRKEQEDRMRKEKDDRMRKERDDRMRKHEEDRMRKEEEHRMRKENKERQRKEREDRMRQEREDRMKKHEEERMRKEEERRMRKENMERQRKEKEDRMRQEKEDRMKKHEEERMKKQEEQRMPKQDSMPKQGSMM